VSVARLNPVAFFRLLEEKRKGEFKAIQTGYA